MTYAELADLLADEQRDETEALEGIEANATGSGIWLTLALAAAADLRENAARLGVR